MSEEKVDYLNSLMSLFVKSPHLSPSLKNQIKALQTSMLADKESDENVSLPVQTRELSETDLEMFEEEK